MADFHKKCLICGNEKLKKLDRYQKTYLVKCKNCGFVFAQRIPTVQELVSHYNGYRRDDYLSPITIKRYEEVLDRLEPYRKTNKMIDVGCGMGYFLEVAKSRGWEVFGTEYTDKAIEICESKGITMHQGVLDVNNYEAESFDVVTSFEVIEHINNPIEEVSNIHHLLRKQGAFYVTTPNFNSLLRYHLKEEYNVIVYPEHLCYYTPKTLKDLMRSNGFDKVRLEATGISLTRLKTSKKVSDQRYVSKSSDDEILRNKIESSKTLELAKNVANGTLTFFGVGDALKATFLKR